MQVAMKRDVIRRKAIEPKSSADHETDARDSGVQSVDRALSIIETLAEDDEGYRLSDLAIRTGLSTSTVHRLLGTLENRRFVQFDRAESQWHVGALAYQGRRSRRHGRLRRRQGGARDLFQCGRQRDHPSSWHAPVDRKVDRAA